MNIENVLAVVGILYFTPLILLICVNMWIYSIQQYREDKKLSKLAKGCAYE